LSFGFGVLMISVLTVVFWTVLKYINALIGIH
jgi:hypothetical protein